MFGSTKPLHDRRRRLTTPALLVVVCGSVLVLGACTPRTTTAVPGSPDASGPAASSVPSTPAGPTRATVAPLDPSDSVPFATQVVDSFSVDRSPVAAVFDAAGGNVLISHRFDNTVTAIDPVEGAKAAAVSVGESPREIALAPDGGRAYVANSGSDTVSFVDLTDSTATVVGEVAVGERPVSVAVSPDGSTVYAVNSRSETVSAIDVESQTVVWTSPVGARPSGIAVDQVTGLALVVNQVDGTVSIIDPEAQLATSAIGVRANPSKIAIDSDSRRAYVTNAGDASVTVVDLDTMALGETIPVEGGASDVVVAPQAGVIYVIALNSVIVIDTTSDEVLGKIGVGTGLTAITLDPESGDVFVTGSIASGDGVLYRLA